MTSSLASSSDLVGGSARQTRICLFGGIAPTEVIPVGHQARTGRRVHGIKLLQVTG